jgi:hypothetical protein
MLKALFRDHPASVDETYGEHMAAAGGFALRLFLAGLACAVHAVLPFLFEKTASAMVDALHDRMVANRRRRAGNPDGQLGRTGEARLAS